jgi:hypothetical protein
VSHLVTSDEGALQVCGEKARGEPKSSASLRLYFGECELLARTRDFFGDQCLVSYFLIIIRLLDHRSSLGAGALVMRTSPHWIRACHVLPHATSRLQLSCHVRFGFRQHPCSVSVISPSSGIETRCIRMR